MRKKINWAKPLRMCRPVTEGSPSAVTYLSGPYTVQDAQGANYPNCHTVVFRTPAGDIVCFVDSYGVVEPHTMRGYVTCIENVPQETRSEVFVNIYDDGASEAHDTKEQANANNLFGGRTTLVRVEILKDEKGAWSARVAETLEEEEL